MGLDSFLFTTADVTNLSWDTYNEAKKDRYSRKVVITFSDETSKQVKAYEIQTFILKTGEQYSVWEIKNITSKGNITFLYWEENGTEPKKKQINVSSLKAVRYTHAYWRKANQIHQYFVDTIQNGEDDCGDYDISGDQLFDLIELCLKVLRERNSKLAQKKLPTQAGFFFGSTDYDNWYYTDLENTVKQLADVKANQTYTYTSSW